MPERETPEQIAGGIIDVSHDYGFMSVVNPPGRFLLDIKDAHSRTQTFVGHAREAITAAIKSERDRADALAEEVRAWRTLQAHRGTSGIDGIEESMKELVAKSSAVDAARARTDAGGFLA